MSLLNLNPNPWSDGVERLYAQMYEAGGRACTEHWIIAVPEDKIDLIDGPFTKRWELERFEGRVVIGDCTGQRARAFAVSIPCDFGDAWVIGDDRVAGPGQIRALMQNESIHAASPFVLEVTA